MSNDYEPMTATDAVRMWELEQMSLPERVPNTAGITYHEALGRLHHGCEESDRREGMCDENANMCRDIVLDRIAALEAENARLRRDHLPHMCRDGHAEIRHALSDDDERCPVCRERDRADDAALASPTKE